MNRHWRYLKLGLLTLALTACSDAPNDPYPVSERGRNILYSAFVERPKHLDPARSYSEDEINFTAQIYQPMLQYHYLKRPFTLIPDTLQTMPRVSFLDAQGRVLSAEASPDEVHESVYEFEIKRDILYQPHPAFARGSDGRSFYLGKDISRGRFVIGDFEQSGTRQLRAEDYVYQIKRLAHPRLNSPIYGMMAARIVGLSELGKQLDVAVSEQQQEEWLDLDRFELSGAQVLDDYRWRLRVRGKYPQFLYWLAMPFFAPVPREVDRFFNQPGMAAKNLTLDWWPVGTGPYMLTNNDPNQRMVMRRNPNFKGQSYPCDGSVADRAAGLLDDCGQALPLIDEAVFSREKESLPYWNKFLQGYYDASGISEDSFDQAITISVNGNIGLSDEMRTKGIDLSTSVRPSIFYLGFNMLDPVVGGLSPQAAKLRQAISIAIDVEEYISIFNNGRGIAGHGPLPPGLFGYMEGREGVNPYVYDWVNGKARRKSIAQARRLLAEAGYPDGISASSGKPLVLYLDTTVNGFGEKSRHDWLLRQFSQLDIQLVVRDTDYNRYQDKLNKGAVQMFFLGWNADYPDPENFMFLLHGAESKAQNAGGQNSANYANPEFDRLFEQMKNMDNSPRRLDIIKRMVAITQHDAPWIFWLHPKSYVLSHAWMFNRKPNAIANNTLKYQRLDPALRERQRKAWNQPLLWPLYVLLIVTGLIGAIWWLYSWRKPASG